MNLNRKEFLGSLGALAALAGCKCPFGCGRPQVALQLYSIRTYINGLKDKKTGAVLKQGVGLAQALKDVRALGYTGVEFINFQGYTPADYKAMLADADLAVCGTHLSTKDLAADTIAKTCEYNLAFGNSMLICPGGGNMPKGGNWKAGRVPGSEVTLTTEGEDDVKRLCDLYNNAAVAAAKYGCKVGLHNHTWEFGIKMKDGTTFWDYFFSHTIPEVCMEQDVGWTVCAGYDPCEQFRKYPHRSPTLHAKENGMGPDVKEFDAILGQPGRPGAKGVDWDKLAVAADADGVKWWVVECEKHEDTLNAVRPSIEFLKSKGR